MPVRDFSRTENALGVLVISLRMPTISLRQDRESASTLF